MFFLREAFAIARKEILLDLRFALRFLLQSITSPLARFIPFFFVYTVILQDGRTPSLPGITAETYLPFLILGALFHTAWTSGASIFEEKFRHEKFWQTADLLFLVPIRTSAVIVGVGIAAIARLVPTLLFFLGTTLVAAPPSLSGFLLAVAALALTLGIGLSFGLIFGGASLSTENAIPFFQYAIASASLLSAFFYPLETLTVLPQPLPFLLVPLVRLNPLYAGVTFARAAWYGDMPLPWMEFLFLAATLAVMAPLASGAFRAIWRKFGIQG